MKQLMILKLGSTFQSIREQHGDFEDHLIRQLGVPAEQVITVPIFEGVALPSLDEVSGILLTGSHAMVSDREPWSTRLAHWLRHVCGDTRPILGICYGHQLLADAWGGLVANHPGGREVGTVGVDLSDAGRTDPLLSCLPPHFSAHVFHTQSVRTLPPEARLLAGNPFEPHHAFVIRDRIWGVQFHPEFTDDIIRAYVREQAPDLAAGGLDPDRIEADILAHPWGRLLLRRFLDLL